MGGTKKRSLAGRKHTAKDVSDLAGLSYRQINDWEEKGILPSARRGEKGWRKFSAGEVFIIAVCARLRKQFGASRDQLKFIRKFMCQPGANHFEAAVGLMRRLRLAVFLVTDFEKVFVMDSSLEVSDMFRSFFGFGEQPQAYAFLKVNDIVNKMIQSKHPDVEIKEDERMLGGFNYAIHQSSVHNDSESQMLSEVRKDDVRRVEVIIRKGKIDRVVVERDMPEEELAELKDAWTSVDFGKVTVQLQNGEIVDSTISSSHKPQPEIWDRKAND